MLVISNTSPLYYLTLIGQVELLPRLFGEIMIPESVRDELNGEGAADNVRRWIASPPFWLQITAVAGTTDVRLSRLHQGEQDVIRLGGQMAADLLILDERAARQAAVERGLQVTGLVGILDRAAAIGVIELAPVAAHLRQTNFRIAPRLWKQVLDRHRDPKTTTPEKR